MKISELQAFELEQITHLRKLSLVENNVDASRALLEHLRAVSKQIDEWRRNKDESKKKS